jgi:hypothetical protein
MRIINRLGEILTGSEYRLGCGHAYIVSRFAPMLRSVSAFSGDEVLIR